jgi:hypothetical protein
MLQESPRQAKMLKPKMILVSQKTLTIHSHREEKGE